MPNFNMILDWQSGEVTPFIDIKSEKLRDILYEAL